MANQILLRAAAEIMKNSAEVLSSLNESRSSKGADAIFSDALAAGIRAGQIPGRTQDAREWFRQRATEITRAQADPSKLLKADASRFRSNIIRNGDMFMFRYDAKHKDTLPYYDQFPLVFPIKRVAGGFLGINMHYLPHTFRAILMDRLYVFATNDKYDDSTRLKINYDILNNAARLKYFRPTVKMYLKERMRSRLLYVYPSEWDIALFLPSERFKGAKKEKVHRDSRRLIKERG